MWTNKYKRVITLLLVVLLILLADWTYYRARIYPGVYFNHIHLGGKTEQEAANILKELEISLRLPSGRVVPVRIRQLGITLSYPTMNKIAMLAGRTQPWPLSYLERYYLQRSGRQLPAVYEINEHELQTNIQQLCSALANLSRDAKVEAAHSSITIKPEQVGYKLSSADVQDAILRYLNAPQTSSQVDIPGTVVEPHITVSALQEKQIQALRGTYTTTFDASQKERTHNIRLAAKLINDQIIEDGEVFSLNAVIGDITAEKGYKKAPIIVGEELIPGYGGGLCQISTTLYNAALLAGLTITERHPHGMVVPYVPPGRDATIAYPGKDLKIKNSTGSAILISSELTESEVSFSIFGAPLTENVLIETKILDVIMPPTEYQYDPTLEPGEERLVEGEPGYIVEAMRVFLYNDVPAHTETLSADRYTPYPIIVHHGNRQN